MNSLITFTFFVAVVLQNMKMKAEKILKMKTEENKRKKRDQLQNRQKCK